MVDTLQFFDVSGVGSSGKSAVVDLLRECDGIYVPHFQFEFDLIRVPDGLLDLRRAVAQDWSPIRSHSAINRFRRLSRVVGGDPAPWNLPGLIASSGQRYSRVFGPEYFEIIEDMLRQLVIGSYRAEWPYTELEMPGWRRFLNRIARRMGFRAQMLHNVFLVDGKEFDAIARNALTKLYRHVAGPDAAAVVLNNGIEPYNPVPGLDLLGGDSRQIVVLRDPRDIFASGQARANKSVKNLQSFDNDGFNKTFLASNDPELFCKRMALHLETLPKKNDPRVLRLWFEDLVLDPDKTAERVFRFLGIQPSAHVRKGTHFIPENSRVGVGVHMTYPEAPIMGQISTRLSDYLYPGNVEAS